MPAKIKEIQAWIEQTQQALADRAPALPSVAWPRHPIYSEGHPTEPTCLYNTRIYPIVPFAMRGAIWYQGESNMGEAMLYYEKMKALIGGWRTVWHDDTLSFYSVQLAPFRGYGPDDLPRIWEAQVESLKIPRTGLAVINDIGNIDDIHPRNKRDVGKRLALWALAKDYGREEVVYCGPMFKGMTVMGQAATLTFDHVGQGLTTRDGQAPDWFEIAGADKVFYPAQAKIVANTIQVSCDKAAAPVAVRFAWDNTAEPNLMNKDGLPASSFRTDRW
jgi:sialate O-acetylesterase